MLLEGYSLEIFKSHCDPGARGVHCFVHLQSDISQVLPYLNSVLGGFVYTEDPPTLTLKVHGKLITFHGEKIAINALQDKEEAEKIADWLQREINQTWEQRAEIEPSTKGIGQPVLLEVLKLLPRTNCGDCGQPTCLVFASQVVEGGKNQDDCPPITPQCRTQLEEYLAKFQFD